MQNKQKDFGQSLPNNLCNAILGEVSKFMEINDWSLKDHGEHECPVAIDTGQMSDLQFHCTHKLVLLQPILTWNVLLISQTKLTHMAYRLIFSHSSQKKTTKLQLTALERVPPEINYYRTD